MSDAVHAAELREEVSALLSPFYFAFGHTRGKELGARDDPVAAARDPCTNLFNGAGFTTHTVVKVANFPCSPRAGA